MQRTNYLRSGCATPGWAHVGLTPTTWIATFLSRAFLSMREMTGAIYLDEGKLNISGNTLFSWNAVTTQHPDNAGGAIAILHPRNLSITGASFISNVARDGGAIWVYDEYGADDRFAFGNLAFDNNSAAADGGAVFISTPSVWSDMWNSTFHRNIAGRGRAGTIICVRYFNRCS